MFEKKFLPLTFAFIASLTNPSIADEIPLEQTLLKETLRVGIISYNAGGSHFNITGCTILDGSPSGILLENVSRSRVSDCLIDEPDASEKPSMSLRANGGTANVLADNRVGCGQEISSGFSDQTQSIERIGGN